MCQQAREADTAANSKSSDVEGSDLGRLINGKQMRILLAAGTEFVPEVAKDEGGKEGTTAAAVAASTKFGNDLDSKGYTEFKEELFDVAPWHITTTLPLMNKAFTGMPSRGENYVEVRGPGGATTSPFVTIFYFVPADGVARFFATEGGAEERLALEKKKKMWPHGVAVVFELDEPCATDGAQWRYQSRPTECEDVECVASDFKLHPWLPASLACGEFAGPTRGVGGSAKGFCGADTRKAVLDLAHEVQVKTVQWGDAPPITDLSNLEELAAGHAFPTAGHVGTEQKALADDSNESNHQTETDQERGSNKATLNVNEGTDQERGSNEGQLGVNGPAQKTGPDQERGSGILDSNLSSSSSSSSSGGLNFDQPALEVAPLAMLKAKLGWPTSAAEPEWRIMLVPEQHAADVDAALVIPRVRVLLVALFKGDQIAEVLQRLGKQSTVTASLRVLWELGDDCTWTFRGDRTKKCAGKADEHCHLDAADVLNHFDGPKLSQWQTVRKSVSSAVRKSVASATRKSRTTSVVVSSDANLAHDD